MGIKKLEKELDSGYYVTIDSEENINFGGPYKHDIVKITKDYEISPKEMLSNKGAIKLLSDIVELKESGKLKEIIESKDEFENLIDVYTFDNGKVIREQCEIFGYPNTTINGHLMYDNTYFLSRKKAFKANRRDCKADISNVFVYSLPDYIITSKRIFKRMIKSVATYIRSYVIFGY